MVKAVGFTLSDLQAYHGCEIPEIDFTIFPDAVDSGRKPTTIREWDELRASHLLAVGKANLHKYRGKKGSAAIGTANIVGIRKFRIEDIGPRELMDISVKDGFKGITEFRGTFRRMYGEEYDTTYMMLIEWDPSTLIRSPAPKKGQKKDQAVKVMVRTDPVSRMTAEREKTERRKSEQQTIFDFETSEGVS